MRLKIPNSFSDVLIHRLATLSGNLCIEKEHFTLVGSEFQNFDP